MASRADCFFFLFDFSSTDLSPTLLTLNFCARYFISEHVQVFSPTILGVEAKKSKGASGVSWIESQPARRGTFNVWQDQMVEIVVSSKQNTTFCQLNFLLNRKIWGSFTHENSFFELHWQSVCVERSSANCLQQFVSDLLATEKGLLRRCGKIVNQGWKNTVLGWACLLL